MADAKQSNFDLAGAYAQAQPAGAGMEEPAADGQQAPAEEVTTVAIEIPSDQLSNIKALAGEGRFEEIGKLIASIVTA